MSLTIGIVLYNEEKHLELLKKNLCYLQKYPQVKIIIVDNASTDSTLSELLSLQTHYNFQLLTRKTKCLGPARAEVVNYSHTDWVAFIDGDCEINSNWLNEFFLIKDNVCNRVAAIGGPLIPGGRLKSVYQAMFTNILGHFNSTQAKSFRGVYRVDHIPTANVFYKRHVVLEVGNFNPDFTIVGEDLDLSYKLRKSHYELWIYPQLSIVHTLPDSIKNWFSKVFKYGWGRALVGSEHKDLLSYKYLMPFFFAPLFLIGILSKNQSLQLLWLVYLFCILALSIKGKSLKLWYFLFLTHLAYSLGLLAGLMRVLSLKLGKMSVLLDKRQRSLVQK